jgi:hypothetical protein
MFRHHVKLFYWMLRVTVPLALVGMLAIPFLLQPPADVEAVARGGSPQATLVPVGAGNAQYSFLRLSNPALVTVQLNADAAPSISESRSALFLYFGFIAMLMAATWQLWRPRRAV